MNTQEMQIREKEITLKRREQTLSLIKFVLGVLVLGFLSFALDVKSFLHTLNRDDRDFLSTFESHLREPNLQKRLENIAFLQGITGPKSEYLSAAMEQTKAEIEAEEKLKEKLKREEERERAERRKASAEEVKRAKEAERQAEEAVTKAKRRAVALRTEAQKAYDRALQEAYPHKNLFDLKRRGAQIP